MEELHEEMRELNESIRRYERELNNTVNNEDRRYLLQIILEEKKRLNILYQQLEKLELKALLQQQNYSSQNVARSAVAAPESSTYSTTQETFNQKQSNVLYEYVKMTLYDADGSLTSLSEHKGFRNYVKAKADSLGIVGTIQRCDGNDVVLQLQGTIKQVRVFRDFIKRSKEQDMIGAIGDMSEIIYSPTFENFTILKNLSTHLTRGRYSDKDDDRSSRSSRSNQSFKDLNSEDGT